jgi:hypothetical protein
MCRVAQIVGGVMPMVSQRLSNQAPEHAAWVNPRMRLIPRASATRETCIIHYVAPGVYFSPDGILTADCLDSALAYLRKMAEPGTQGS